MDTKICSKCKKELPLDMFRWKNKAQGKKHSQCKDCQKTQEHQRYLEDQEKRETIRSYQDSYKLRKIDLVNQAKRCGCLKCGELRPYVLDFHHRDKNEKVNNITYMIKSRSYQNLKSELDKTDCLCANCHREWHHFEALGITYQDWLNNTF